MKHLLTFSMLGVMVLGLVACAGIEDFAEDQFPQAADELESEVGTVTINSVEWSAYDKYGVYEDGEIVVEQALYAMDIDHDEYVFAFVFIEKEDMGDTHVEVELIDDSQDVDSAHQSWLDSLSEEAFDDELAEHGDLDEMSRTFSEEEGTFDSDTVDSLLQ